MDRLKQLFEAEARDFDRIILTLIPDYRRMVEALVAALPFERSAPILGLNAVFGCGTGTRRAKCPRCLPKRACHMPDLAENMIALAQAKLARYPVVRFVVGDFAAFDGKYDVVIS